MSSYLIFGSTSEHRYRRALKLRTHLSSSPPPIESDPDTIIIQSQKQTIGIDQVRQLKRLLPQKPASGACRFVLVHQAQDLTIPAQNAFLKLLEEPPPHAVLILTAPSQYLLLPTIYSRCQLIKLKDQSAISGKQLEKQQQLFQQITNSSISGRLALAAQLAPDRQTAIDFCQAQLRFLHRQLVACQSSPPSLVRLLKQIVRTLKILNSNTNHLLAIENLLLTYSEKFLNSSPPKDGHPKAPILNQFVPSDGGA